MFYITWGGVLLLLTNAVSARDSIFDYSQVSRKTQCFKHNIQLQLADAYGVPVPGTEFWGTITVLKEGRKVTLQLPLINFQTGQFAHNKFEPYTNPYNIPTTCCVGYYPCLPPYQPAPGGYIYTAGSFLPECVRPTDIVNRSWLVPSDQGLLLPYSFEEVPNDLPKPVTGYILQVTNEGALVIQAAGTPGNVIPAGNHTFLPTDVTYIVESTATLKYNTKLSTGRTNNTEQPGNTEISGLLLQRFNGLRDSHINDAYNGIAGWAWVDNSMIANKVNAPLNVLVAIGTLGANGKLDVGTPYALTNFTALPGSAGFDTAVAIDPTNKLNIAVSYTVFDFNAPTTLFGFTATPYIALSDNGGSTWYYNGLAKGIHNASGIVGDNPGVKYDSFGNLWYLTTNLFDTSTGTVLN